VEQRVVHVDMATDEPIALAAGPATRGEAHRVDWQEPPPERRPGRSATRASSTARSTP
jgi:hypothetical protein